MEIRGHPWACKINWGIGHKTVIELLNRACPCASVSNFYVIYRVLSWHEWLRAVALYGNLTCDAILIFHFPICILVQQANKDTSLSLLHVHF